MRKALNQLFPKIEGTLVFGVQVKILDLIESTDL